MFNRSKAGTAPRKPDPKRRNQASPPSLLAESLTIEGNLTSDGDLQIDGTVKGDISCRSLTLGEDGTVIGQITAETLHVRGRARGGSSLPPSNWRPAPSSTATSCTIIWASNPAPGSRAT